eukprot:282065_1
MGETFYWACGNPKCSGTTNYRTDLACQCACIHDINGDGCFDKPTVPPSPCYNIFGGEWSLVRHSYNAWHTATDNLNGTDTYGTYDANPQSTAIWSRAFKPALASNGSTLFMFSNGNCTEWLVTKNKQFYVQSANPYSANIIASNFGNKYNVQWYSGTSVVSYPWISWQDISTNSFATMLYGENTTTTGILRFNSSDKYVNVWIKNDQYITTSITMNWANAKSWCESQGTQLASIHSEQDLVRAKLKCEKEGKLSIYTFGCWIGLNELTTTGTWEWTDNTATDYGFTNNDPTQPTKVYPWGNNQPAASGRNCICLNRHMSYRMRNTWCDYQTLYPLCNNPNSMTTSQPTMDPTIYPTAITIYPTSQPTNPSISPTAATLDPNNFVINSEWVLPNHYNYFMNDPFSRFEAQIKLSFLNIGKSEFSINCLECFVWEYKKENTNSNTDEWEIFNHDASTDITVYNKINNDVIVTGTLIISSIRNENNGYCFNVNNNHILQFGNIYKLRLRILSENNSQILHETQSINIITNTMITSGYCSVEYDNSSSILDKFNLNCNGFYHSSNSSLKYNALMNDILLSSQFANDPTEITGLIGVGNNMKMVALIADEYGTITCFKMNISFPDINVNDPNYFNDTLLPKINNVTQNKNLCGDQLSTAITIHSVIEEAHRLQLTSTDKATMVIDDIIYNIINCSLIYNKDNINNISNKTNDEFEDIIHEIVTISVII